MTQTTHEGTSNPRNHERDTDYIALNAELNKLRDDGSFNLEADKKAAREYFLNHINQNTVFFHSLSEKLNYLVENDYYEKEVLDQYSDEFIKSLFQKAYSYKFRFESFIGAYKYYTSYTLKTFDGKRYLERFEDRVSINALYLAAGDEKMAMKLVDDMMSGRFQPATPTFLNAGKKSRGELVSCFLIRFEDSMESIGRNINSALQLSKRGGGVALNLSNLRETGAPIKHIENQASGVIPVMKMLEDAFSYANQLGARQGAGAVYLNAHHPDIFEFLDTKRENADEKVRIKTLSTGVVIPDITIKLAVRNEPMYLFSPYDVERVYGKKFTDISITEHYYEMVENPDITKKKTSARKLLDNIAKLQFESGYPYIMFEDHANKSNPIKGRINMSNLCTEILQVNSESVFNEDLSYATVGKDISCNLGSLNIAKVFDGDDFASTVETAVRALTSVSDKSNIACVPSVAHGNAVSHAIGLGQMNLHGFLGREHIFYNSPEAVDFTNIYFYAVLYQCLRASHKIAVERSETFEGFEDSDYANGSFFDKYIDKDWSVPETEKVRALFKRSSIYIPTVEDWKQLKADVMRDGIYNSNLQAVPPTGSISYINNSTSSIHPIASRIEARKEGRIGRVYYAQPHMTNENIEYFQDAYEIGPKAIIDVYAAAQQHVDQGLSLTLFYNDDSTTGDLKKMYLYAWSKGIKTLYYARVRQKPLLGTEVEGLASNIRIDDPSAFSKRVAVDPVQDMLSNVPDGEECESCAL